jgi:hypothetical protein
MSARRTAKRLTNKTCGQIADLVVDFITDSLAPRVKRDFVQHLAACPDCAAFLNTYKKTIQLTRSVKVEDMPVGVRDNILAFLRGRTRVQRSNT